MEKYIFFVFNFSPKSIVIGPLDFSVIYKQVLCNAYGITNYLFWFLGYNFLQFQPKSALNFSIFSIKPLISLIKLISSLIKYPNLLIFLIFDQIDS
jgi:hypothetical protein